MELTVGSVLGVALRAIETPRGEELELDVLTDSGHSFLSLIGPDLGRILSGIRCDVETELLNRSIRERDRER